MLNVLTQTTGGTALAQQQAGNGETEDGKTEFGIHDAIGFTRWNRMNGFFWLDGIVLCRR